MSYRTSIRLQPTQVRAVRLNINGPELQGQRNFPEMQIAVKAEEMDETVIGR